MRLAGTIFFTWTDEWFTGGQEVTDWAFGIVTRERQPKKAFHTISKKAGAKRFDFASPFAAEHTHGIGHCLFLQRGPHSYCLPRL